LWVGVIWLVPLIGGVLYLTLGINRIRRRAIFLRGGMERKQIDVGQGRPDGSAPDVAALPTCAQLNGLPRLVDGIVPKPLLPGNRIDPLVNGDEAYPAMVQAIESAEHSITLATYIFDNDAVGRRVAEALVRAHDRGVEVRVLVDDTGARYSFPPIVHL